MSTHRQKNIEEDERYGGSSLSDGDNGRPVRSVNGQENSEEGAASTVAKRKMRTYKTFMTDRQMSGVFELPKSRN